MKTTLVALWRGINVGPAKRVSMAELKAALEAAGFADVRTLLNSGNAVCTAPPGAARSDPASRMERAVLARTGVVSRVTALPADEWAGIARRNPLARAGRSPSLLVVCVLADPSDRARLAPLARRDWAPEALVLGRRAAYAWCPGGQARSPAMLAVARALGERVTSRTWATVQKLAALAGPGGPETSSTARKRPTARARSGSATMARRGGR